MRRPVLLLLPLLLCLGCARPSADEVFIKAQDAASGVYSFTADFCDSLLRWDLSFYTRIDASPSELSGWDALPLEVVWTSPSGQRYGETAIMPLNRPGSGRAGRDIIEPYRSGVAPFEAGMWRLDVTPSAVPPGFRGLGFILRRCDGTR